MTPLVLALKYVNTLRPECNLSRSEAIGQHGRHPGGSVDKAARLPRRPPPGMRGHKHHPLEAGEEGAEGAWQGSRPHDRPERAI